MITESLLVIVSFLCGALWMYFSMVYMLARRYHIRLSTASKLLAEITKREEYE